MTCACVGADSAAVPRIATATHGRHPAHSTAKAACGVLIASTCGAHFITGPGRSGRIIDKAAASKTCSPVTGSLVGNREALAYRVCWIAPELLTVGRNRAVDRLGAKAHAILTYVELCAGIPVVTGRVVGFQRIVAGAYVANTIAILVFLVRIIEQFAIVLNVEHTVLVVVIVADVTNAIFVRISLEWIGLLGAVVF